MIAVTITDADGVVRTIAGEEGVSLMTAARDAGVEGVIGECGGFCACGTCHVRVDEAWRGRLDPPGEQEAAMLEGIVDADAASRLACQIVLVPALDRLVVAAAPA